MLQNFKRASVILTIIIMLLSLVPFGSVAANEDTFTLTVEQEGTEKLYYELYAVNEASATEFNGCYGNQLSGLAKEFYDSLVENFVAGGITDEYTHSLDNAFVFDAEVKDGYIQMTEELERFCNELGLASQIAKSAFLYDYPEIFWFRNLRISYAISAFGGSNGYIGKIEEVSFIPTEFYLNASSDVSAYNSAVEKAVQKINASLENPDDEIATVKAIHDYICNAAYYAYNGEVYVHCSAPVFIGDGGVVCEGYSKAFKVLCNKFSIPCVLVSGDAGGDHMWNYVKLSDGKWYLVDVTWDDQDSRIYYTYMLANSNSNGFYQKICDERTEDPFFAGTESFAFAYPVLSTEGYTAHTHEWESDYTVDVVPTCSQKGSKSIHCKFCDETKNSVEIAAKGHSFTEQLIDEAHLVSVATIQSPAVYSYDCAFCDAISDELTFTYGEKLSAVGKPENVTAIQNTSTIKLTWEAVQGAAGYKIYQLVNGSWKSLGSVTSTSATITKLAAGTNYSFAIKAAARIDGKVIWADGYTVIKTATKAAKPAKITSAQNANAIKLTWTPSKGATGYRIFYKSGNNWKVTVSSTAATSHTFKGLKPGAKFTFAVRPYISTESGIVWSDYTTFTASTTPATPVAKLTSASVGKVSLTWNPVAGADGYQVYYKVGNGSFRLYKTCSAVQRFNFSSLKSGTKYTFAVRAFTKTSSGNVYGSYKPVAVTVK